MGYVFWYVVIGILIGGITAFVNKNCYRGVLVGAFWLPVLAVSILFGFLIFLVDVCPDDEGDSHGRN